jgi:hypothetical protein
VFDSLELVNTSNKLVEECDNCLKVHIFSITSKCCHTFFYTNSYIFIFNYRIMFNY